jgi:hypothetical protein
MGCPARTFKLGNGRLVASDFALYTDGQEDAVNVYRTKGITLRGRSAAVSLSFKPQLSTAVRASVTTPYTLVHTIPACISFGG